MPKAPSHNPAIEAAKTIEAFLSPPKEVKDNGISVDGRERNRRIDARSALRKEAISAVIALRQMMEKGWEGVDGLGLVYHILSPLILSGRQQIDTLLKGTDLGGGNGRKGRIDCLTEIVRDLHTRINPSDESENRGTITVN